MKTIKVKEETHKILFYLKYYGKFHSMDELLIEIAKYYKEECEALAADKLIGF